MTACQCQSCRRQRAKAPSDYVKGVWTVTNGRSSRAGEHRARQEVRDEKAEQAMADFNEKLIQQYEAAAGEGYYEGHEVGWRPN